jgi:predicted alpha/beta hydrolase family esterase
MSRASVLILPGLGNSGPDHWQSHWERRDPACLRVVQREWEAPDIAEWVDGLRTALAQQPAPVVLAAHSSACVLVAHWAAGASADLTARVRGAFLVGPSDPDGPTYPAGPTGFGSPPLGLLPFPSIVVASTDDRYVSPERAQQFATAWGARLVLLTGAGHINVASGFGPWPEGFALLDSLRG